MPKTKTQHIKIDYRDPDDNERLCVRVEHYGDETIMPWLVKPDEIVIPEDTIQITFDYPLSSPCVREFKSKGGFTREKLFECIAQGYRAIYAEEDGDVGGPTGTCGTLINRARSNGRHGIWGHDINDLFIEGVDVTRERGKPVAVDLVIGS